MPSSYDRYIESMRSEGLLDESSDDKEQKGIGGCGYCMSPADCEDKTLCFGESSDDKDSKLPPTKATLLGLAIIDSYLAEVEAESSDRQDAQTPDVLPDE